MASCAVYTDYWRHKHSRNAAQPDAEHEHRAEDQGNINPQVPYHLPIADNSAKQHAEPRSLKHEPKA